MRASLIALAAGTAVVTPHAATKGNAPATEAPAAATPAPRPVAGKPVALPPFAAQLAQMAQISDGTAWQGPTDDKAWELLAAATPDTRQSVRWSYARGLIGAGRGAEALGVLETMRSDDDDLALVTPFQLAMGAALALVGRDDQAIASLASPDLAGNPEACAWRMRALAHAGAEDQAAREINCSIPAINARAPFDRRPFMRAAAEVAIDIGQPASAIAWLKLFGDSEPEANLLRGRALLAMGDTANGTLRLARAEESGDAAIQAGARLGKIEAGLANHSIAPTAAFKQLEALRYGWRGDAVEENALRIEFKIASEAHDLRGSLRAGATLFRYFKLGSEAAPMLAELQTWLSAMLAPESGVSLPDAAGLYWDYKELAPSGAEGDALALRLAGRLQAASLYGRAAELLQYQLTQRREDVAQGPLSVKVAALHILAGRPDRALSALRDTEQPDYTDQMRWDRKRVEAVALHQLGKDDAAMAALDQVPDAAAVRAEIHWRSKNWGAFVTESEAMLPAPKGLGEPGQAAVLRQAVALAMLGREDKLQALRARYLVAFKALPSARAFDVLTRKVDTIDPAELGEAMAAIPEASPAGAIGDLLDASST
ncbi:MAG: hypothetical protein ABW023_13210 [Sphingomonas sp.]